VISAGRRALVLAPHTDDGEFGCGGTIARLVEAGADVHYAAFSTASRSLPEGFPADTLAHEVRAATSALGIPESHLTVHDFEVRTFPAARQEILEILVAINTDLKPDLVLMPSLGDIHQDHETIAREGTRAFKRTTLLGYEIPWNCFNFQQQAYVSLEPRHLDAKVSALQCYESQQHRNYANEEYIRNIARTHGIESGRELAEVFEVYRWVM
jgi:LmbE family N-acetylglucosaminyl deacetylase